MPKRRFNCSCCENSDRPAHLAPKVVAFNAQGIATLHQFCFEVSEDSLMHTLQVQIPRCSVACGHYADARVDEGLEDACRRSQISAASLIKWIPDKVFSSSNVLNLIRGMMLAMQLTEIDIIDSTDMKICSNGSL